MAHKDDEIGFSLVSLCYFKLCMTDELPNGAKYCAEHEMLYWGHAGRTTVDVSYDELDLWEENLEK